MSNDTDEALVQDEFESLKNRANMLGVKYHPSISIDKLRTKVNAVTEGTAAAESSEDDGDFTGDYASVVLAAPATETDTEFRTRMRQEASKLIRIRLTCMNPNKTEWEGEIVTAGNAVVGSYKKFVPFNAEEDGWHVPNIIYKVLVERQCQVFQTIRDSRGNNVRKGKLIKEFAIEVLPQLTKDELHELAQRQAMAKSID